MGNFTRVIQQEKVKEGKIVSVDTKFLTLGLTKFDGSIIAFEDVCTHDGGSIASGEYCDGILTCPRHLAKFDIQTGEALCLPAIESLPLFNTRVVDGYIEVELEE
jgi:3-phenylpropionate/trans-cinnamate dioxygenase ferredoxin component